jgi:ABC-type uncharacterized transport system involved in gliding motility auxiliary subunit
MLHEPRTSQTVQQLAANFGIIVGDNVVLDQVQRLFAGPALGVQPIVRTYATHNLTRNLSPEHITIFGMASSVSAASTITDGGKVTELIKTGPSSWAESDLKSLLDSERPSATFDETSDKRGPVALAAAYERKINTESSAQDKQAEEPAFDREARVVVFGDSDWVNNASIGVYANRDLAMNTVNWLVGEEGGITLRPKSIRASTAPISRDQFAIILASSLLIPELLLIGGLWVWWRRRSIA